MNKQQLVEACHGIYRSIAGPTGVGTMPVATNFDSLPVILRQAWLDFGTTAQPTLEVSEGQPVRKVSQEMFTLWGRTLLIPHDETAFDLLPPAEHVAWEAVTRFLWVIVDDDDPNYAEQEQQWRLWGVNKLAHQSVLQE